jgi:hypothetical protein
MEENTLTTEQERCAACGNLYHEATGHRHTPTMVLCGVCARDWKDWLKGHLRRRWGGKRFYDYAWTSIVPGRDYTKEYPTGEE